ncbi:hypothetical protein Q5P01_018264 [Channa striata]|uniref:Uncharacterized protein n=1 Tax=Channa striata TaxID=64152 RepID=A0AA88SDW1_CHASR|nr:hypothetical protein Q5P01_018264 [Channa striata]
MRNHIIGSLHRYNYIKTWQPHLVSGWKEKPDLSKLAWPLMDIAKILEGKEGPGNVQLLEVEEDVYQRMTTHSENDAITLINYLRDGQGDGESKSHPECTAEEIDHYCSLSNRVVLLGKNQRSQSQKSLNVEIISHKISSNTNESPALFQSSAAPSVNPEGLLKNILTSQWDGTRMASEPSMLLGNGSFLDGYTGNKPLIGLFRVVECRSEVGLAYCFLCHCCRIRSNKRDILDHLTSSSHLINYLVETHPEQVEFITAAANDNYQVLQSLAKKIEKEEGRGEVEIVNAPESLCILLTGKSYHWCIKMLYNSRLKKETIKGSSVNSMSIGGKKEKYAVVPSKCAQRMTTKKKKRKVKNTMFKVSLPLTKGAVLLERTPFSEDSLPASCAYSPLFDPDLIPSTVSQTEDFDLDSDIESFAVNHTEYTSKTSKIQVELFNKDAGAGQYMGPEGNFTVTQYKEVDGHFSPSEDTARREKQEFYAERKCSRHWCPQERLGNNLNKELKNEGFQTQHEWLSPAVSHNQHWPSCNSSVGCKVGYTGQWYNAASEKIVDTAVEVLRKEGQKKMRSDAAQQDHTNLVPGCFGHHFSGELVPLDAGRISVYSYLGDSHAQSANTDQEARAAFHGIKRTQQQTYREVTAGHVPTAPQSFMTQPMSYQPVQVDYGVTYDPNYSTGPRKNYYGQFYHASSGEAGGTSQSNSCTPAWQAPAPGAQTDVDYRATALSGVMISGRGNETLPFMHGASHFEFCI